VAASQAHLLVGFYASLGLKSLTITIIIKHFVVPPRVVMVRGGGMWLLL